MRFATNLYISISFCCIAVYANATSETQAHHTQLDQSQNIFFDQITSNTFSLPVLQIKDKFKNDDLVFGGSTQFDAQHWHGDKIVEYPVGQIYDQGGGFYFTQADINAMANINSYSTTYFSLAESHIGRNDSNANYIYIPHAFIIFGNLDKSPIYNTVGIDSIPFGVFTGSGPWDTPLTALYFNPAQAPQISLGYFKNGLNVEAAAFNDESNHNDNYAYSLFYNKNINNFGYNLGVGYLSDLKTNDTNSINLNHNTLTAAPRIEIGDLGAILDTNGGIHYKHISLNGEYVIGHKKLNGNKHNPSAFSIVSSYVQNIADKDTTFGISRSKTFNLKNVPSTLTGYDNLSMALPGLASAWSFNVSRHLFQNVFLGLDLQKATTNQGVFTKESNSYTTTVDLAVYL